jgi:sugar/nucleoside kinase (ribokinase family)
VVKQGADGATFCDGNGIVGQVGTARVDKAYTVGAGDTFNAGLLHGLSTGLALGDAVQMGVNLATKAVRSQRGALGAVDS